MNQSKYELNLIEYSFQPIRTTVGCGVMKVTPTVNWHENIEILYCMSLHAICSNRRILGGRSDQVVNAGFIMPIMPGVFNQRKE